MTTRKSLRARAMLLEAAAAAAAVAALVLLTKTKTLMAAVSAASPTPSIGLPGCVTSCGDVAVPFPFGIGPAANCSLPGFNLTCDLEAEEGKLEVHITWLGLDRSSSTDLLHVLACGGRGMVLGSDVIVLEPVPLRLEWEVIGAVPDTTDTSDTTRDCIGGPRGGGY